MHRAELVAITTVKSVTGEIRPFVEFKAFMEKRDLKPDQKIAILLVETTACYIPIFLDEKCSLERIKEEVGAQVIQLSGGAESALRQYLEKRKTEIEK